MKLRMRPAGALLLLAAMSACDLPSGLPRWETTWITPGEETRVSVAELLPAGLSVNNDTSAFVLAIDPVSDAFALSDFCTACPAATATAPKPAFNATVSTIAPIPAGVESVEVESGTIDIVLTNGFDFDPLRPGVDADSGSLTINIRSAGEVVASTVVDGTDVALAPGSTLAVELAFAPTTIAGDLEVELTLDSPAGDEATLSPNDALGVSIETAGILVSEAVVELAGQAIEGTQAELDFSGIEDVEDRLNEGTIFLDIENPFGVTGDLVLELAFESGPSITKPVDLAPGNTTVQVDFTRDEIRRLAGETSELSFSGTVNGASVPVRPDMALGVTARLRVVVEVGGEAEETGDEDEG